MQVFGFRERYRSAFHCYTHRFSKLRCTISLFLICATQFHNRVHLAAQFRNWLAISKFLICAAQFQNCVNLQIARNIHTVYNHLNINSAWKTLVASCSLTWIKLAVCVCVAEAQTRIFNTFLSSAKVFVSSTKLVRLQPQKCSSSAQNVFATSNINLFIGSVIRI